MIVCQRQSVPENCFLLPREVFNLELPRGALLVYLYLIHHKYLRHGADKLNCATIGRAIGLCAKTVQTHLHTLVGASLIQVQSCGGVFSYSLCPIQNKVREHRSVDLLSEYKGEQIRMKQTWITGEMFEAVFPLPNEVFQLGLKSGELLVYLYLQYQKGAWSNQCYPSYSTIGAAVGMSRKTVQKHIQSLVDRGLVQVENTTVRWKDGCVYNGNLLYTLKPIEQVLKEQEMELLDQLKLAEAQRKWDERVRRMAVRSEKTTTPKS